MIALLQRVSESRVVVEGKTVGKIGQGLMVLLGFQPDDNVVKVRKLIDRLLKYRVFADTEDKMNLSVVDIKGGLLLVPQFTLAADTRKGTRPGFSTAAAPEQARKLFDYAVSYAKEQCEHVQQGQFGADMKVHLINDGPVTFQLCT
jgi:D-tyrosyl-tRNA(Tyr) deacylase